MELRWHAVGAVDDFDMGSMTEVSLTAAPPAPAKKVLLVRTTKGDFHATGAKCTYETAPPRAALRPSAPPP